MQRVHYVAFLLQLSKTKMPPSKNSQSPDFANLQSVMIVLSTIGTLLILIWVLKYSFYGMDFTDEAFYLVSLSNPFAYDFSLTQFGFVYNPLYMLLDGDIAAIRQINIIIVFGLAWSMVYIFLASIAPRANKQRVVLHTVAAGMATSSCAIFDSGLLTPNYNSLALQALIITAIGLLLVERLTTLRSAIGWVIIGVGGWLAFMAKPSTALALAVSVLIYLLISHKLLIRLFLLASTIALLLLLLSAMVIDGSVSGFINRLLLGIDFAGYLEGGHTINKIFRINGFQLNLRNIQAIGFVFIISFIATWGILSETRKGMLVSIFISFASIVLIALLVLGEIHQVANLGRYEGLLIIGVGLTMLSTGLAFGRFTVLKNISIAQWSIMLLFLAMPHIYAFGTNNNYWIAGSSALIFWLLAGLVFLTPLARERATWSFIIPMNIATQAVTATLLQTGMEKPYRQPQPLRLNNTALEIGSQKSSLILSEGYASYITEAVTTATNAGFNSGTPVIDLSGQSPGILYALGAESIGMAWIIGRYPGSLNLAKTALKRTSCKKIATAWILYEPDGPRSIPIEVMSSLGSKFPENYKQIGIWQTAKGAGGYDFQRTQKLYSPMALDETLQACQSLRKKSTK